MLSPVPVYSPPLCRRCPSALPLSQGPAALHDCPLKQCCSPFREFMSLDYRIYGLSEGMIRKREERFCGGVGGDVVE